MNEIYRLIVARDIHIHMFTHSQFTGFQLYVDFFKHETYFDLTCIKISLHYFQYIKFCVQPRNDSRNCWSFRPPRKSLISGSSSIARLYYLFTNFDVETLKIEYSLHVHTNQFVPKRQHYQVNNAHQLQEKYAKEKGINVKFPIYKRVFKRITTMWCIFTRHKMEHLNHLKLPQNNWKISIMIIQISNPYIRK